MSLYSSGKKTAIAVVVSIACVMGMCFALAGCAGGAAQSSSSGASSESSQSQDQADTSTPKATAAGNTASARVRTEDDRKAASNSVNDKKPDEHVVYLTFDDGPSTNTHRILEILDTYGVKATWFVKGQSPNLEYVKDIWADGNQVATHTNTHDYTAVYASVDSYWDDLEAAGQAVSSYLGFKPSLVRFPGGSHNSYNTAIADTIISQYPSRGYHYFDWNVSSGDGADHTASEIANYVIEGAADHHSCCVLMHDSAAKDTTVEALPTIIEYFIDEGYTFDVLTSSSFGYHF